MVIGRLYTGADGKSHFEEWDQVTMPILDEDAPAKATMFRVSTTDRADDWHNAPRRQYIVTLSGTVEVGLRDGNMTFGPGDVFLAEDLTGEGHTTSVPGPDDWRYMTVALAD
jgi:quercetin dioxygenase-like cupin family protein